MLMKPECLWNAQNWWNSGKRRTKLKKKNAELCQKSWFLSKAIWSLRLPWQRQKWWTQLCTHLIPFSSMQLGICHEHVFLLLGGAAAVPLKRLGQEDGFAQWPLWQQLKFLSACWGSRWRPRKDCMRKKTKRLIRRKLIASGQTMSTWSFTGCRAGSCRVGQLDAFFRFFSRILASARLSADQNLFSSSESSASSSDS